METIEQRSDFLQLNFFHVIAGTQMSMDLQDCVKVFNDESSSIEQKYEALAFISENKPFYDMLFRLGIVIETKYLSDWNVENFIGYNYFNGHLPYLCSLFCPITRFEQFQSLDSDNDEISISLLQMEKLIRLVLSLDNNQLNELVDAKRNEIQQAYNGYFEYDVFKDMLLDFRKAIQKFPVEEKTLDHYLAKYHEWCVKHNAIAIGFIDQSEYE